MLYYHTPSVKETKKLLLLIIIVHVKSLYSSVQLVLQSESIFQLIASYVSIYTSEFVLIKHMQHKNNDTCVYRHNCVMYHGAMQGAQMRLSFEE